MTATAAPRPSFDLGVNSNEVIVDDGTNGRSLGEIARESRLQKSGSNAHVYTNDDMERAAAATRVSGVFMTYHSFVQNGEVTTASRP